MTELQAPLAEDVAKRRLHVHIHDLTEWAPEYREPREQVLDGRRHRSRPAPLRGDDGDQGLQRRRPRLASRRRRDADRRRDGRPELLARLPAERPLSERERGAPARRPLRPWREMPLFASYDLHPGDGFAAPPRWPHWIEHPGPDPAVSFEVGLLDGRGLRARKVWDVNWLLRKASLVAPPARRERSARRAQAPRLRRHQRRHAQGRRVSRRLKPGV